MNRFFALGCVLVAAFCCCITTSAQAQWTTTAPPTTRPSPPFGISSVPAPGLPTGPIFPGGLPSSTGPFFPGGLPSSTGPTVYPGYDNSTCTPSWNATIPICNGTTSTGPFFSAEWNTTSCQYECQPYTCYSHQSCLSNPSWYGCDGETYQCSSTLYTSFDSWSGRRSTQCYTNCAYLPMCEPTYNTTIPTCSYGGSGSNFSISDNGTMVATGPKWNTTSCQYECQNITCPDQDRCERENWCGYNSNPPLQCVSRLYFYQRDYRRSWKSSVCSTGCEAIPLPPLANDTCIPSWNTTMQNSTNAWNSSVTIIPNCNSSTSGPFNGLEWNTTSCQYECQTISCPTHQRCEQQGWCNYNNYYTGRPQMCSTQVYTTGAYQRPWLTSQCSTGCVDRPYNLTCKPDANTPLPSCATNATQTINGTWVASGAEWNITSCQYECVDKICPSQESCERGNWCGSVPGASCSSQVVTYDTNNWYQPWKISQCNTGCRYEPVCLPSYNTTFPYNVTCNITLSNNNITNTNGSRSFSANRWNTTTCSYECELLTCPAPSYCYCGFGYTCEASFEYYGYYAPNGTVYIPRCGTTCVAKPRPAGFPTFNPNEERSALVVNNYGYASYVNTGNNATDMDIPHQNQERTYTMWIKSTYNNYYYYQSEQVFFGMSTNNASQDSAYSCWYTNTTGDDYLVIGRTYSGDIFARTCRNYISISYNEFGGLYQSQWYHIAFVYRPADHTAQLFVNGYTNSPQYWSSALNTSCERVVLGANPLLVNEYNYYNYNYNYNYYSKFNGEIGKINFYRFALTPEAIYSDVTYGVVSTPASRLGAVTYNGKPQYGNLNKNLNQTFTLYSSYIYLTWNETIWSPNATCTPSWNATIPVCNSSSTGPFYSTEWNTTSCQYECQPFTCYSHQSCLSNPSWYGCDGETYQCSSTLSIQYDSWSGRRYTQCSTGCAYLPMCEPSYNETIPTCSYGGIGSNFTINDNGTMIGTGPKWNTTSCRYECQNITCPDQDRCERENWCAGYGSNPSYQCVTRLNFYQTNYRRSWKSSVCSTGCEPIPVPPLANDTCIPSWNTTVRNTTSWSWNTTVTIIPNCNSSTSGPFNGLEWNTTSCQYECQTISCPTHQRCEQQGWCNYNNYYTGRPQMCSTQVYTTGAYQRPWLTSQCSTGCVDRPYNLTCKPDANTPLPSCATNATRTSNGTWIASGVEWNITSCQYECIDHICPSHQVCERDDWCGSVPGGSCSSQVVTYDTNNWYQPWKISQCNTGCRYEPVCLPSNTTTYPYNVTCNNATLNNTNITNTNGSRSFSVHRWNTTTCSYQCEIKTCPKPAYCYCGFGYTCEATITTSYYGTNSSYVIIPRCSSQCVAKPRPAGFPTFNPYEDRSALITNGYSASYISSAKNATNDMNIPYQNQERTYTMWIKSYNYYYNYNYYWQPEQVFFGMTKNNTNSSTYSSCWYNNTTNNAGDEDLVIGRTSYGEFFARTCRNYISIGAADFGDLYSYQWIHVAFVYRPASRTAQLFVNGYTNGPQYWSYSLNTSRERVVLGANPVANSYSSNFNGEIGRMNFYRFALTAEAIYSDVTYGVVSSPSSRWGPVTYNGFPQYGNLNNRNQTFTLYGSYVRLSWNETNWNSSSSTGGPWWPTQTPSSTGGNNGNNTYNCAQHTDCLSCLTANCGWCSTMGRCVAGSNTRSDNGICSLAAGTWSWNYEHCFSNGTTTTPPTTRPPTTRPPITTRPPSTTQPPTKPAPTTAAPTTPVPTVSTTFNWTSLSERTWNHPFKSSISFTYNNPPHNVPLYVRVQGRSKLITQGTTSSSIQVTADVDLKGKQQLTSMTVEILRDDQDGIPIAADHIYTQVVTRSAISRVAIPEQILNAMANGEDATLSMQPCPPTANTGAIVGGVVAAMTALIILSNIATHVITKRQQPKVQSAPAVPAPVTETWQANPAVASTEGVIVVV